MGVRLRAGASVHIAPFSGAFVVDRAGLAAEEIDDELAVLLTTRPSLEPDDVPASLRAAFDRAVAEGWLTDAEGR
jgi:hypothetical protein